MTGQILESVPATLRTCLYNSRATVQAVFVHPKETDLTWLRLLPRSPISDDFLVFKKGSGFTSHFAVGYAGDEKTVHFFCFFSPMEELMPYRTMDGHFRNGVCFCSTCTNDEP